MLIWIYQTVRKFLGLKNINDLQDKKQFSNIVHMVSSLRLQMGKKRDRKIIGLSIRRVNDYLVSAVTKRSLEMVVDLELIEPLTTSARNFRG